MDSATGCRSHDHDHPLILLDVGRQDDKCEWSGAKEDDDETCAEAAYLSKRCLGPFAPDARRADSILRLIHEYRRRWAATLSRTKFSQH